MKKTTQTLLLVFSTLLLLVSVTVSAQGHPAQIKRTDLSNFTGAWNTITDKGEKLVITLRHERADPGVVTGSYHLLGDLKDKPLDGGLKGTVTKNVLRFTWSSDKDRRAGRFTLSSDGESFEGTYSPTNNPDDTSGGTWNGTRAPNFAGAWRGKLGESFLELTLQQNGDRVTGQFNVNSSGIWIFKDGIVDGNRLRFTVVLSELGLRQSGKMPGSPDQAVGVGELVIDRGSKSFKGTVLGAATSGTLITRR